MGIQLPLKMGTALTFRPMSIVANGWMDQDATWYGTVVDLGQGHIVLDGAHLSLRKGAQQPSPLFSPCLVCPNGCPSQLLLSSCIYF